MAKHRAAGRSRGGARRFAAALGAAAALALGAAVAAVMLAGAPGGGQPSESGPAAAPSGESVPSPPPSSGATADDAANGQADRPASAQRATPVPAPALTPASTPASTPDPAAGSAIPTGLTSRSLFFGTTFWGRYTHDQARASELGLAYPFAGLKTLKRDRYDAWIAELECPIVKGVNPSAAQQEAALAFNCRPEYLTEAAHWFTAFSLATNHAADQGRAGQKETKRQLDRHGIAHFGNFDPEVHSDLCEVVALPAHLELPDGASAPARLPVALCGYHGVFKIPSAAALDVIARYAEILPVIAMPHMGAEYQAAPDEIKTSTYRAMIDRGADMVLGDHPHWVQTTEAYRGRLIVYSMGNFMFDQQNDPERTRSAAIDVTMRAADPAAAAQWSAIADDCAGDLDGCAELAAERGLGKLELDYRFRVVATVDSDHRARKADQAVAAAVKDRLRWDQTMAGLD
ncbi:MAG: CapA family protein [Bifidobacteriaceae bacterium]|jgi:poly-gamma-glutamate synthesis protein (capsule biosynthesis protein)|nr:CapA family protein [Bifidobacteriaceae bacterium]